LKWAERGINGVRGIKGKKRGPVLLCRKHTLSRRIFHPVIPGLTRDPRHGFRLVGRNDDLNENLFYRAVPSHFEKLKLLIKLLRRKLSRKIQLLERNQD